MTTPPAIVRSCMRTLTNWPGHRVLSALSNSARARKVPLSLLIWLSMSGRLGADVVARWPVSAADWERFRAIDLAASGVRAPALDGLQFIPGSCPAADGTEIIVGPASVLVGDYFLSFTPRHGERWAESVHWLATNPRCIALVIVSSPVGGKFGRWLLLLPVPETARDAGAEAMRHYNSVLSRP